MKRRLLNLLTAGSLLVCAAVAVLWVRSYWRSDYAGWQRAAPDGFSTERAFVLRSTGGRLLVQNLRADVPAFDAEELAELRQMAAGVRAPSGTRWGSTASRSRARGPAFDVEQVDQPLYYRFAGRHQTGRRREFNAAVPH
jgi:hypothetical protein